MRYTHVSHCQLYSLLVTLNVISIRHQDKNFPHKTNGNSAALCRVGEASSETI